jgi:ascorbate-specific PTS system EIIC-type component UlaA
MMFVAAQLFLTGKNIVDASLVILIAVLLLVAYTIFMQGVSVLLLLSVVWGQQQNYQKVTMLTITQTRNQS